MRKHTQKSNALKVKILLITSQLECFYYSNILNKNKLLFCFKKDISISQNESQTSFEEYNNHFKMTLRRYLCCHSDVTFAKNFETKYSGRVKLWINFQHSRVAFLQTTDQFTPTI